MKIFKRLFITLVAVLMVLTYAPTKVSAEGNVAKIGDTEYPTLAEAVSAATKKPLPHIKVALKLQLLMVGKLLIMQTHILHF